MHVGGRGGQASCTFLLGITCKKGGGGLIACKITYVINGRSLKQHTLYTNLSIMLNAVSETVYLKKASHAEIALII